MADDASFDDEGTLVLEQRFAIVPEWIIDAPISDCAFRLYAVLLRYGQTSGQRMPGRALLARRLHKGSKDTVDRALKELAGIGAVVIERRRAGRQNLTNRYHVRSTPPDRAPAATPARTQSARGSRSSAATQGGRTHAATPDLTGAATPSRISAATLAAGMRPDREVPTESNTPPPQSTHADHAEDPVRDRRSGALPFGRRELLERCGIENLEVLAGRCQRLRLQLGQNAALWSADRLVEVLGEAVARRGWPPQLTTAALLRIASDPLTRSPMRLACPGPWWDEAQAPTTTVGDEPGELAVLEARLLEADGLRVWAQQRARGDLTDRGQPLTRLNVARRACELLDVAELTAC